ncbi:MAG: alpha/beta hydrolase [bacterium]|nr:alpha/beta hydrolase [bacterium]MDE0436956.1 alpha/beta hydrolase [bacterium]
MESVRRGYVDVGWGQVHYRTSGERGPVALFFHESPLSSMAYEQALPYLGRRLRAYAFDTPGYGSSDPPPHDRFEIPDYSAMLLQAADALGLDTFAVSGVHTGASLALEVALQAEPGRATHAILSGVPLMTEEDRRRYLASWAPSMRPTTQGEHLEWAWQRYQRIWGADSDPGVLHVGAIHVLSVLDRYQWAYNAAFRYDPEAGLRRLACPTLLLDAEFDIFADQDEPAAALIPDARISIIRGLPGQLPIRVPEEYAARIIRFVAG